jgi:muramoyltetrapeptide carboxypeptidase LdcA involved in peptidoglycan recycling
MPERVPIELVLPIDRLPPPLRAKHPHRLFMGNLAQRPIKPGDDYFQRLVAKAIVWKRTERLVTELKTDGKILFIEDVGEYSYNIDRMFYQLKRNGKFSKLAGLIIGGFTDMKDTDRPFGKTVYEIIRDIIKEYNYPVCFDFPVSHSDKNYALKIGIGYKLKVGKSKVNLEE